MGEKPFLKYLPFAIVAILIVAGLAKCAKKETAETAVPLPAETVQVQPKLAQNILQKPAVSAVAPVVIDEDLIPKPREIKKDPDEEASSGPAMF